MAPTYLAIDISVNGGALDLLLKAVFCCYPHMHPSLSVVNNACNPRGWMSEINKSNFFKDF
jgi:hypothetical protein